MIGPAEFNDRRLVTVYDAQCPWSRDDDFFLAEVSRGGTARVLDLGCGSGRMTLGMAAAGHLVTGVDPAGASLEAARAKPGAEQVTWIEGTSAELPDRSFDVAVMTSHVAQFLVGALEWKATLGDLARSLITGGRLVFDARDPRDRSWDRWNPTDPRRRIVLPDGSQVVVWTEVDQVADGVVRFTHHYLFPGGEELLSQAALRFRTEPELRSSLGAAGFALEEIYGGWDRQEVGEGDGEFLVIARRLA